MIFGFRDFPVYRDALEFRKAVKELLRPRFPREAIGLRDQLWRALDSVLLNIAEGSDKYSKLDSGRFINTSLTSLNEVIACLDCAADDGCLSLEERGAFIVKAGGIAEQLMAFSSSLRRSHFRGDVDIPGLAA